MTLAQVRGYHAGPAAEPWDPVTYIAAPALFIVLAGLAAYVPARRAAGVDPAGVLRAE